MNRCTCHADPFSHWWDSWVGSDGDGPSMEPHRRHAKAAWEAALKGESVKSKENPNPSGQITAEDSLGNAGEPSGPVGLGPDAAYIERLIEAIAFAMAALCDTQGPATWAVYHKLNAAVAFDFDKVSPAEQRGRDEWEAFKEGADRQHPIEYLWDTRYPPVSGPICKFCRGRISGQACGRGTTNGLVEWWHVPACPNPPHAAGSGNG